MTAQYVVITHKRRVLGLLPEWPWFFAARLRFYDDERFAINDATSQRIHGYEATLAKILESNSHTIHETTSD